MHYLCMHACKWSKLRLTDSNPNMVGGLEHQTLNLNEICPFMSVLEPFD